MRFVFTIVVAIVAFLAGMWYAGEFDITTTVSDNGVTVQTPDIAWFNTNENMIVVDTPKVGMVGSTFTVSGKARGGWYFEASFPLEVRDGNGNLLIQMPVQAQGEWMTPEFVPFSETVTIANYKGAATLILHKDNPSGLPENDASVSIPIIIQ